MHAVVSNSIKLGTKCSKMTSDSVFAAGVWRQCLRVYARWRKIVERSMGDDSVDSDAHAKNAARYARWAYGKAK